MNVTGGELSQNRAVVAGSGQASGGAVYAGAFAQVNSVVFDSNRVIASNPGQPGIFIRLQFCIYVRSHCIADALSRRTTR